jgi:hypothetical protein
MAILQVGRPFPNQSPLAEGAHYAHSSEGQFLTLIYNQPSQEEIREVATSPCAFALCPYEEILFFLFKFGTAPWSDAPFTLHLVPSQRRYVPPGAGHNLLNVTLISQSDWIVRALRTVSLSAAFAEELGKTLREQSKSQWNESVYDGRLQVAYGTMTSEDLLQRATVRSPGGADPRSA